MGPFAHYEQIHGFEPINQSSSWLNETVEYELPAGGLAGIAGSARVHEEMERLFKYRHQLIINDMKLWDKTAGTAKRILISGSTGLLGSHLVPLFDFTGS